MQFIPPFPALSQLRSDYIRSEAIYLRGRDLYEMDMCTLLEEQAGRYLFRIEDRFEDFTVQVDMRNNRLSHSCSSNSVHACSPYTAAALIWLYERFEKEKMKHYSEEGERYSREEMIDRVLREREERAKREKHILLFSNNVYGIHTLKSESGRVYGLTIRDFDSGSGYCTCPDYRTNKLATCKHLMALLGEIRQKLPVRKMIETQPYPFVEIYCDPKHDYHITYYYKGSITVDIASLLDRYFHGERYIYPDRYEELMHLLGTAEEIKHILVRPEVVKRIEKHFETRLYERLAKERQVDFSSLKVALSPYQEQGVRFSLFKPGAIIADEMGLGKTIQAVATALLKKEIYGLRRTLIICPVSLKYQWKEEIERICSERADMVEGTPDEREAAWRSSTAFFLITNYETAVRDVVVLQNHSPDMIVLDEAQRIKNYETKTSYAVKAIPKKHSLVLTGTPIENRLGDLYSIMNFIDPDILAPLWDFSMRHCMFDKTRKERITGYYDLQALKERLKPWVLRREKRDVLKQLPKRTEISVPVSLHPKQREMHTRLARTLTPLLHKKMKTAYDVQRIQRLLNSMRMACNSTFLVDRESNYSAKLQELEQILFDKLDLPASAKKIVIFSEWKGMLRLIDNMLQTHGISAVLFSGDVPVKERPALVQRFNSEPDCLVFLSSEAGGSGLNLQSADTVINMELPWNPARKSQHIGGIDRIGQKSSRITAISLIARNSIEERIRDNIALKESLYAAVFSDYSTIDNVDLAAAGHAGFVDQVQELIRPFEQYGEPEAELPAKASHSVMALRGAEQLQLFGVDAGEQAPPMPAPVKTVTGEPVEPEARQLEQTLQQGMQFLRGLMNMATGKEIQLNDQSLSIDKETGEVVLRFRLPDEGKNTPDAS